MVTHGGVPEISHPVEGVGQAELSLQSTHPAFFGVGDEGVELLGCPGEVLFLEGVTGVLEGRCDPLTLLGLHALALGVGGEVGSDR